MLSASSVSGLVVGTSLLLSAIVMMVFRNDLAVRLLAADPEAGFEAPIRIYLYENADGTATVSYVPPSVIFAPYRHPEVQAVAAELEPVLRSIVDQAVAAR